MVFNLHGIQHAAKQFMTDNSTTILTAGGVVGTVTTAVLAGRAGFKAAEIIQEEQRNLGNMSAQEMENHVKTGGKDWLETKDKVKLVWPQFVPPVLVGSATIGSIVMANRMSAQKAAALAAAYGVSQNQLQEYRAKVEEKLGFKKEEAIRDEVQQDRVNQNPPPKDVIIIGSGEVLCYDAWSGRYFKSSVEAIRKAENAVHREIMNANEAPLRTFYDELGLLPVAMDNELGWNLNHPMHLHITSVLTPDETEPCIAIEFTEFPIMDYREYRHHG